MITLQRNGKPYFRLKDKWEELTPEEFYNIIDITMHFGIDETIIGARVKVFEILTGYKRSDKKRSTDDQEQINSNIVILADQLRFFMQPHYHNPELLAQLPEELQEKLETVFPQEITDHNEQLQLAKIINELQISFRLRLDFNRNPLTKITSHGKIFYGPQFDINTDMAEQTDIIAIEFVDACDMFNAYNENKNTQYLDTLCAILYRANRNEYNQAHIKETADAFKTLDIKVKTAVYMVFQRILIHFRQHPVYTLLYDNTKSADDIQKINTGSGAVIDSMVKEGLGTRTELKQMNISEFMALQLNNIKSIIGSLRSNGKKEHEIARLLEMPIENVMFF